MGHVHGGAPAVAVTVPSADAATTADQLLQSQNVEFLHHTEDGQVIATIITKHPGHHHLTNSGSTSTNLQVRVDGDTGHEQTIQVLPVVTTTEASAMVTTASAARGSDTLHKWSLCPRRQWQVAVVTEML